MALSFSHRHDADAVTVAARGEVDLSTADDLSRAIEDAVAGPATTVTVDLGDVTFLDSAGINVLLRGRRLADERGTSYHVTNARGMVGQLLRMTGVWDHLTTPAHG
ncbi:STAS domain-containing protein [Micromonospora costi]|uniref:STAS domain-containing protein n=1 Tax=Micromonospora costi TaxID=1530042 RepID=UPI001319E364|nr:STAS domain-containing protein [Micromonospora costi]